MQQQTVALLDGSKRINEFWNRKITQVVHESTNISPIIYTEQTAHVEATVIASFSGRMSAVVLCNIRPTD